MRLIIWLLLGAIPLSAPSCVMALCPESSAPQSSENIGAPLPEAMDSDLLEVTIPEIEKLYAAHRYTVTQVVRWYMARIKRYDGIYRAVQTLDAPGALATAAALDAAAKGGGSGFQRGSMWGVPILIKANTSVKGLVTTDGWQGYCIPGHELGRATGCNRGSKTACRRRHHPRADEHAGLCRQRYQSQHSLRAHWQCI